MAIKQVYQAGSTQNGPDDASGWFDVSVRSNEPPFAALERHFRTKRREYTARARYAGRARFAEENIPAGEVYHVRCDDNLTWVVIWP